jgi:Fe-Mn family superoxide dismutase
MYTLPPLPYAYEALEPFISAETLHYHYDKHHQTYVDNLNRLLQGKEESSKTLEEIIISSEGKDQSIFNNAAQIWNHTFYWNSMKPQGGEEPTGALAEAINRDFGSFAQMKTLFKEKATAHFGSGWCWLVQNADKKLEIITTKDAELPLTKGKTALIVCDLWEHAYYIDYRNARAKYLDQFLDHLVNWNFAVQNYTA